MVQTALAPLGPVYAAELHLTRVQVGALFAAASVAMLLVTLPIGVVTDRLGPRRLTVAAALLVGLSALGQGLARDFWLLLGSRALFGVAFGAVWTAGLAFLAEGGTPERPSSLGATIPITGVAGAIGPAFAGIAAARFGLVVPFVGIAAVAGVAAVALVLAPAPLAPEPVEHLDLAGMLRAARDNRLVLGAAAMMAAAGFSSSVAFVLVPLRLRGNGISVATIGAILGGAAVLYIAAGIVTNRLGRRAATPSAAAVSVLALGLVPILPAVSLATVTLVAFLFVRAACNADRLSACVCRRRGDRARRRGGDRIHQCRLGDVDRRRATRGRRDRSVRGRQARVRVAHADHARGRSLARHRRAANASAVPRSAFAPLTQSSHAVSSPGSWLRPPRDGTKIIPAGVTPASACASWPAPE
jgi:MFS family permease